MSTRTTGNAGEEAAAQYLSDKGYEIAGRNYRAYDGGKMVGELDIIAVDGECVVFAEVKTRKQGSMTSGAEAVGAVKRRRLLSAATLWLMENECELQPRFDVVEVINMPDGGRTFNHIENAFGEE